MIPESEIAYHCPARTFQRGVSIAANDRNFLTKLCQYGEYETLISAFVASSNGWQDRYRTAVTLDEDRGAIEDYSCTCPAYFKYDGMCKHAVALALTYNKAPSTFLGYREKRVPETSASIREFMQRAERISREADAGTIRLEPTLRYGFEDWSIHFKVIGPKGSYVIKSIGEFAERLRQGESHSYGKKLTFTHTLDAFEEASRKLAQFILRAVSSREQQFGGPQHHTLAYYAHPRYSAAREMTGRNLSLTEPETVELLDALGAGPVNFEGTDYGVRSRANMRIVDADPPIELRMAHANDDGYLILRDEEIVFAAHDKRMYVLHDDTLYRCSPKFAGSADFFRSVYRSPDERLYVSADDMPLFCATVLPALERQVHVRIPADAARFRPVECRLSFYFDRNDQVIELLAKARYGSDELLLVIPPSYVPEPGAGEDVSSLRDERTEDRARALAREFFYEDATVSIHDDEAVARLLFGGMALFQAAGEVLTTPAFDRLLTVAKPRTTMGLSIVGNLINLDISSEDVDMSEVAAMLASYRKRKHFHRLRSGAFVNLEEYDLAQLERLADDLGISAQELASGHLELPTYRAFYLDQELGDARREDSFTRYVNQFKSIDQSAYRVPASLAGKLRPYQEEGFRWLRALTDMGFGGILADEMGLGKSIQLISLLLAHHEAARHAESAGEGAESAGDERACNQAAGAILAAAGAEHAGGQPSLIVCPASLVYNWLAEFERFAPSLRVQAIVGPKRERALLRAAEGVDVFVTSYDLLRIDAKEFERASYRFLVLDEAQYIKNHATLTTRAVKRVPARHRFALTGTPMENRLSELWSIFDFLMPGLLGSYMRFRERYEASVVGGDEDASRRLQALVGPFVLRRLKADVLPDLPEKMESVVYVPLAGEQRRLYAAHEQKLRVELGEQKKKGKKGPGRSGGSASGAELNKVEVLAELTRLRQICCDPALLYENYRGPAAKMEAILELVGQAMESGRKVLVFSQFTSYLARIADALTQREISFYTITGSTPKQTRLDLVNAFNEDDTPVFLVSLKAGGTGLNLVGASVVIHADPWWNAAAQNQATDRAHRIGQERDVSVYRVIAKDSIEERILRLQEAKTELAGQIIGTSGAVSLSSLTREDLIDLLKD